MDAIFGGGKKKKTSIKSEKKAGKGGKDKGKDKKGSDKGGKDKKGSEKKGGNKTPSTKDKKKEQQNDKKKKKLANLSHLDISKRNTAAKKQKQASAKVEAPAEKGWWDAATPAEPADFDVPDYDDGLGGGVVGSSSIDSINISSFRVSKGSGGMDSIDSGNGAGSIGSLGLEQGAGKKRKRKGKKGQGVEPTPTVIPEVTASIPESNEYMAAWQDAERKFPPDMHRIFDNKLPDNRRSALFDAIDLDVPEKCVPLP
jgi:hypothetical protein